MEIRVWNLTVSLCVVWALTLLYGEMFAFWVPSLWSCSWPHHSINGAENHGDYVKIAVLTDPQLMDRTSHSLAPESVALEIAQFYTDLFMRRAFFSSILPFKPDMILFLGDYFDGGPVLSDEEWQESLSRFRHIFHLNMLEKMENIPIHYISGNHDIGYAAFHSIMPEVIRRYEKEFGPSNYRFTVGKVDVIAIDSQTLDGPSQGNPTATTWNFIKNVSQDNSSTTRILLTHIPLYRPDWTSCGPHRSSSVINQRVSRALRDQEITYQNYISEEKTNDLLELIRPALVLSGHDHDQCSVSHMTKYGPVKEHTLGTISWQQGNLYPSFMLLSASNHTLINGSGLENAISTQLCFLPTQTFIYLWYLFLFVLTIFIVVLWPTNGVVQLPFLGDFMGFIKKIVNFIISSGGEKEKNEDENCEYEMIWDAEGSMHLIKKSSKAPTTPSSERVVVERGNAVLRSTAKKPMDQEIKVSIPSDGIGKSSLKTNKSGTKLSIRRLLRTIRIFIVVAAVNVPLYMMLLFKDWINK